MGLPVFHIKGGHHVVALKHTGEVVDKAVQQGVLARTGDKYRNKSCRFYLCSTSQAPGIRSGSGWVLNSALFSA